MFGFNRFRNLFSVRRQQEDKEGIQLLASMLVCYPELESVSYLPRDAELILDFIIQGKEEQPELEQFLHFWTTVCKPIMRWKQEGRSGCLWKQNSMQT